MSDPKRPRVFKQMADACEANDGKPTLFSFEYGNRKFYVEVTDVTQSHLEVRSGCLNTLH